MSETATGREFMIIQFQYLNLLALIGSRLTHEITEASEYGDDKVGYENMLTTGLLFEWKIECRTLGRNSSVLLRCTIYVDEIVTATLLWSTNWRR